MTPSDKPIISVIVPIYNVEKYLSRCLESLINQTFKNIEIICVNDGSADKSSNILDAYAKKDNRIKIINQNNQKQGAARNNGTKIATGEYIGYIDSDDWVDLNYFEKLYVSAKKFNSDIALATNIRIGNGKTKKRLNIECEKVVTDLQDKYDICNHFNNECPTNKIYRLELLKNNNIVWPEGVYCEDKLFTTQAIYYANSIVSVPNIYYYYYRNPKSTVNNKEINHSKKKQQDKNNAKLAVLKFLRAKKANIKIKKIEATTKVIKFLGIPIYIEKESLYIKKKLVLGLVPIKKEKI